jgi:hypothetical protein
MNPKVLEGHHFVSAYTRRTRLIRDVDAKLWARRVIDGGNLCRQTMSEPTS